MRRGIISTCIVETWEWRGEMLLLNRRGGRCHVRPTGIGGGGMKRSVEKKDRAGSGIKLGEFKGEGNREMEKEKRRRKGGRSLEERGKGKRQS